jgi:plastocyanin
VKRRFAAVLGTVLLAVPLLAGRSPHAASGTIEGRVIVAPRPPVRVANPYAGLGAASRTLAPVPMVAYLEGAGAGRATPPAAHPALAQRDTAFAPGLVVVPVGTTVEFTNRDGFFHNVFSYSPAKRFDLGRYPRGESRPVTFDRAGSVKVFCEIHRWMRAGVVVVENDHHAQVRADGGFTLRDVPEGTYRLSVWDFDRGVKTVNVVVPGGGTARVDVRL